MSTTTRKPKTGSTTFSDQQKFINRELSWLNFNSRVLDEATSTDNLLLDRLKFIAIFSSNLDEFVMVRMAALAGKLSSEQMDMPENTNAEKIDSVWLMTPQNPEKAIRLQVKNNKFSIPELYNTAMVLIRLKGN